MFLLDIMLKILYNVTMRNKKEKKPQIFKFLIITAISVGFFELLNIIDQKLTCSNFKEMKNVLKSRHNKLMIVAHPDDEVLWGGSKLIANDYVVVCITCGRSKKRLNEIKDVLKETDDILIYLGIQDKKRNIRNNMNSDKKNISDRLDKIIKSKNWELIVTHNKNGEYGHIHHKITNQIVTDIIESQGLSDKLYYFGKYYKKVDIDEACKNVPQISSEDIKKKKQILKKYQSQNKVIEGLGHMIPFEDWEKYNNKDGDNL